MKNIIFTPPADQKIKSGEKSFTARFWSHNYSMPKVGETVTASTGRRKETRFAKLRIVQVIEWSPVYDNFVSIVGKTGLPPDEIGKREGFRDWDEFFEAYAVINGHLDPEDPDRSHYFIEFDIVEVLNS